VGSLKEIDQLVELGVNGRILTWILKICDGMVGWINLARQMTGCCEHGNERSGSKKVGDLLAIGGATGFSGRTP
jgi:hypothetical protein